MSLTSYLYQGEVPEPDAVLDMGRQLLIASTLSGDEALDETICASMLDAVAASGKDLDAVLWEDLPKAYKAQIGADPDGPLKTMGHLN